MSYHRKHSDSIRTAFRAVSNNFGHPQIDLFASKHNKKCQVYCSWKPDREAVAIDALTISWKEKFFYSFPPFSLILCSLQKIEKDGAEGIMIVPYWPRNRGSHSSRSYFAKNLLFFHQSLTCYFLPTGCRTPYTRTFPWLQGSYPHRIDTSRDCRGRPRSYDSFR